MIAVGGQGGGPGEFELLSHLWLADDSRDLELREPTGACAPVGPDDHASGWSSITRQPEHDPPRTGNPACEESFGAAQ